jgi:hypothetical protein
MWFPIPTIWIAQGMSATAAGADRPWGPSGRRSDPCASRRRRRSSAAASRRPAGRVDAACAGRGRVGQAAATAADRPGLGLVQQRQDALVQAGAAQRWPASSGPVAQPAGAVWVVAVDPAAHRARVAAQQLGDGRRRQAMVGQQDHDQAQGGAVRAVEQAQHVVRRRRGQEGLAYTWGTHTAGGLVGSAVLWKASTTREATSLGGTSPPVTSRTSDHPLRLFVQPWLAVGAAQWGCTTAPAPATAPPQVAAGRGSGPFPQRVGDRTDAGGRDLAEHQ